ncbi:MAG: hypothetical protein KDK03_16690, partial [Rhodobacteraceae bacterium]|nr:hypothetical protein [Paracoccaceae bacterium]
QRARGPKSQHGGKPGGGGKGKPRDGGPKPQQGGGRNRPPKVEKPIDPDSPFAALMALKLKN